MHKRENIYFSDYKTHLKDIENVSYIFIEKFSDKIWRGEVWKEMIYTK